MQLDVVFIRGHVASNGKQLMSTNVWWENFLEGDHLEDGEGNNRLR